MLADALAGLAPRDQQQLVGAGERLEQRRLVVEVGPPDHDAAVGQVTEDLGAPSGSDDLLGRDAPLQQGFDHQTAQVTGGASDDDGHVLVLLSWLVVLTVIGHPTRARQQ